MRLRRPISRRIDLHEKGRADDASNRRDVGEENEIEVAVERRVDRRRRVDHKECVPVRRGLHDCLGMTEVHPGPLRVTERDSTRSIAGARALARQPSRIAG